MQPTEKLALYPGDGIGPEVIDEAVRVLERVQTLDGQLQLELTNASLGRRLLRTARPRRARRLS